MKEKNVRTNMAAKSRHIKSKHKALLVFLIPTLVVMLLFLVYPIIYTVIRSFYSATGEFVGFNNYLRVFSEPRMLTALRNNAIWVAIVPITVTFLGLVLAVLTQKISWSGAFKIILFMPLVVSGLAAGVTFRFMYATNPDIGLINAVTQSAVHVIQPPGLYPGARPSTDDLVIKEDGSIVIQQNKQLGSQVGFPLIGIRPNELSDQAEDVVVPDNINDGITGAIWSDLKIGGSRGQPESGKKGIPGIKVEVLEGDSVVAETYTNNEGSFIIDDLSSGEYKLRLGESNFRKPFGGFYWLGRKLVVPSIIFAYIWISTGLALIIIGAGLTSISEDYLDAARIAGANEFEVFFKITVPLLKPVLLVVLVRTIISVLKIFDLVLVIAPESVQADATVLALEMWRAAFGGMRDFGLGSALATILFLLILPVVVSNVKRFKFDQ